MGLFDSVKKVFAGINPAAAAITATSDLATGYMAKMAGKEADSNTREMNSAQIELAHQQMQMQREFAQHGIRWKAEDAAAAGLHPLAALGATSPNYSPVSAMMEAPVEEARAKAETWRNMGQNVSRAAMAMTTPEEKAMKALQIERMGLENAVLKRELAGSNGLPTASSNPLLQGQGNTFRAVGADPNVRDTPMVRVVSDPMDLSKEAGAIQDWQIVRTKNGYSVVPSRDIKERIEDSPMEYQWLLRAALRTYKLPDGRPARMNPATGNLFPVRGKGSSFKGQLYDKFMEGPAGLFRQ